MAVDAAWEKVGIGWGAWEVVRGPKGEVRALYPVPAHTLRVVKTATPEIMGQVWMQIRGTRTRYFTTFGSALVLDPSSGREKDLSFKDRATELLLFKSYNRRSPWYGGITWGKALQSIAEENAIGHYNLSFFSSSGTVDRSIHVKGNPAKARAVAEIIATQLREASGQGHVTIITHGDTETEIVIQFMAPAGQAVHEAHFRGRSDDLLTKILIAHQVPPYRVGWVKEGQLGGSPSKVTMDAYRYGVVEPLQRCMEGILQIFAGPQGLQLPENWRLRFREPDWKTLAEMEPVATRGVAGGVLTPNDGRSLFSLPPIEHPAMNRVYLNGVPLTGDESQDVGSSALEQMADLLRETLGSGAPRSRREPPQNGDASAFPVGGDRPGATS
jgi:capsid portal protein